MSRVLAKVKDQFFNPSMIGTYLDKKTYSVLNRYGATVRTIAQRSMRKSSGKSPRGMPPYSHNRQLLRKLLFYHLDKDSKSVIVGPVLKESSKRVMIPKVQEFGGTITGFIHKKRTVSRYPARPYMKPAAEQTQGKIASWYK